jgi:predicted Zn-dependent protease
MTSALGRLARFATVAILAGLTAVAALPVMAQSLIRDAEIERTLAMLAEPVFRGAGVPPSSVDIFIVADRRLNAFVAGGRNIIVTTGLLTRLTRPEQVQAVLAHELGHITGGHLARRGVQAQDASGAIAIGLLLAVAAGVAGSPDAAAAAVAGSAQVLQRSFLAFSRGEEASADQAALTYLDRAKIDPEGLIEVLQIFRGQEVLSAGRIDPYAQTHPMSVDRMSLAETRVAASPWRGRPTDPELAYWHGRMRAKLDGFLSSPERVLDRLEPGDASEPALIRRAVASHRLPDPAAAVAAVDRLMAGRPDDPFYVELKAQFLLESGEVAAAVPLYRRAARLAPQEPLIAASLARALVALDEPAADAEAQKLLESASRADPGNAGALRDLAIIYARAGKEGLAALATAERFALQTRFKDVTIHARRAAALLPEGSPGWLKAQDLILVGERMTKRS